MNAPAFPSHPILLIDDDQDLQRSLTATLRNEGITHIISCCDSRDVEPLLSKHEFEAVLLDLNMPHVSGREILPLITQRHPDLPVIVITGVDEVDTAVKCMRAGAFDYMVKPVDEDRLLTGTRRAIEVREVRRENTLLKQHLLAADLSHPEAFAAIVTIDKAMRALFQYIEAVAGTPQPILITGETGVGKELVAHAIHKLSGRAGGFVAVNIAGLDDNVFSDTLFGHTKGAFTGATENRKGLIEQAAGGTLFLDEIGDMNQMSQVKLLRLSQEREYLPLGADIPKRTTARLIVATNRDLRDIQKAGHFREDLYFRLRSHHVHIPPLRERIADLPILTQHFLEKAAKSMDRPKPTSPPELLTLLSTYSFPGNIRELESMCYDAVSTHKGGVLSLEAFRKVIRTETAARPAATPALVAAAPAFDPVNPLPTMRQAEGLLIEEALRRTNGNQTMAADLLGITRQTINRYLRNKKQSQKGPESSAG